MKHAPDPLPVAGDWLVMADGSVHEVRHCQGPTDGEHCSMTLATPAGCFYWSADDSEAYWTDWSDVEAVGDYLTVDAIAARITEAGAAALRAAMDPRGIAHTTVLSFTVYHAPGDVPPPAFAFAVRDIIETSLRLAGIQGAAVTITKED